MFSQIIFFVAVIFHFAVFSGCCCSSVFASRYFADLFHCCVSSWCTNFQSIAFLSSVLLRFCRAFKLSRSSQLLPCKLLICFDIFTAFFDPLICSTISLLYFFPTMIFLLSALMSHSPYVVLLLLSFDLFSLYLSFEFSENLSEIQIDHFCKHQMQLHDRAHCVFIWVCFHRSPMSWS